MKAKYNEMVDGEDSALGRSPKWKVVKWLWNNLPNCEIIDNVEDVDANGGTITFATKDGEEYTIKLNKGNWREL